MAKGSGDKCRNVQLWAAPDPPRGSLHCRPRRSTVTACLPKLLRFLSECSSRPSFWQEERREEPLRIETGEQRCQASASQFITRFPQNTHAPYVKGTWLNYFQGTARELGTLQPFHQPEHTQGRPELGMCSGAGSNS